MQHGVLTLVRQKQRAITQATHRHAWQYGHFTDLVGFPDILPMRPLPNMISDDKVDCFVHGEIRQGT
jgi:hypothetical protein